MANYSTDLNSLTAGSGVPTGFTSRWDAGTWAVIDSAGDKFVRESSASGNRYFLSMDAVDGDANRDNVEVLMRCRVSNISTPSQTYIGAILRGSGNGTSETGYGVLVVTGSPNLRIVKYSAGTNTPLATSPSTITFNANTWYWIRARVNGNTISGRVWADGSSENTAFWDVSFTDSSITAAGWTGIFGFIGGVNKDISDIAIATNGDTAVMSTPTHNVVGANSNQPNVSSAGVIQQTHLIGISSSNQPNLVSSASAGQIIASMILGVNSNQPNISSTGDVKQTHLIGIASSNQPNTVSAAVAAHPQAVIHDDYERSSVNLSGSSVTGLGDAAIIAIKPRVQESEVKGGQTAWLEPSAKITGINGARPTFRFLDYAATWVNGTYHGVPWGTSRRPMFSYDRLTWYYFDTQTITGSYIEFRHSTAFTSDTVYITRERQVNVTQIGEWIEGLATAYPGVIETTPSALAFTPTLTSWPAQSYISDEFSPQTNELGATIPATPLYSFRINDTSLMPANGVKKYAIMTSGIHAGEDTGTWAMMRATEYLLGNSLAAQYVRRHFIIDFGPALNAPGKVGGAWRGSYTQGVGGADDANRHFNETGSGLEIVNKPKAMMTTDRAGRIPTFVFDWHGKFESPWGFFSGSTTLTSFAAVLSAQFGTTIDDMGALASGGQTEYWRNSIGCPLSMTLEFGNNVPVSDAQYEAFGAAFVTSLQKYFQYVEAANSVQPNTVSAASILHINAVQCVNSIQANTCSSGVINQTHLIGCSNSNQANTVAPGSISQTTTTYLAGSNSAQANVVSSVAVKQTHLETASNSNQPTQVTVGSVKQTHLVTSAFNNQGNVVSSSSVTQDSTTFIVGSNSNQYNTVEAVAVKQVHLIGCVGVAIDHIASASQIVQAHMLLGSNSNQPIHVSAAAIRMPSTGLGSLTQEDINAIAEAIANHPMTLSVPRFMGLKNA